MAGKRDIVVQPGKVFTKGIIRNYGENKTPDDYADYMVNMRIKNGGITPRKGTEVTFDGSDVDPAQGIIANLVNNKLFVVQDGDFRSINLSNSPVDETVIGAISHTGKVRFIVYGKYTIILTGAGYPRVYDGTTLSQLTNTYIAVNTNPSFGFRFAGFTAVNSSLNSNVILFSRPITLANQAYCYDYAGSGSANISFDYPVIGAVSTIDFAWIFTQNTIEYISRDNINTTGGIASTFSIPIASGDELLNADCVCAANDFIFYVTKNRVRKSIGYAQGNTIPEIATISTDIMEIMQDWLHETQTDAFMSYDKQENLVKFMARSTQSTENDIEIIYDIDTQGFYVDRDKNFKGRTQMNSSVYAIDAYSYRVIKDEVGIDDGDNPVSREYVGSNNIFGNPAQYKSFRGATIAGKINNLATFTREIQVDDEIVYTKEIVGQTFAQLLQGGIGGSPIGMTPVGGDALTLTSDLVSFERVVKVGSLKRIGKRVRHRFYGGELGQRILLDFLQMVFRPKRRQKYTDII